MVENYRHAVSTNLLELPGGLIRGNEGEEEREQQQPSNTAKSCLRKLDIHVIVYNLSIRFTRGLEGLHKKILYSYQKD
jgi:hypothetical protein